MLGSGKRKCGIGMAILLGGSVALAGCGSTEVSNTEVSAVVVDMQEAQLGSLTLQNSFVGTVTPQEMVYVIPFASGTITEVNYNVGDHVNAGDVLFRIDDSAARLQLQQAKLSATSAKQQVDMATGSQQSSTDLQLDSAIVQAQSGYEQAQIGYFQAKNAYEKLDDLTEEYKERVEQFDQAIASNDYAKIMELLPQLVASFPPDSVSSGDIDITNPSVVSMVANAQLSGYQSQRDTAHDYFLQASSAYRAAESGLNIANKSKDLTQGQIRQDANAQAKTSLSLAQLGVDSAELALSYYTVEAPISGVIQSRSVEVNGIAASSNPAFIIANEDSMTVTFSVSEAVRNTLQVGDSVTVERNGVNYEGHITEVGVAVTQATGLFQVKASVSVSNGTLPSGVSAKITADTYSEENVVVIPYDAVYYDNDSAYVYLCVDHKAVKTYVTTGIFDDTNIVILDGISTGDMVITSWSPRLLDGVEVAAPGTTAQK
ncbi:MAG: efflux RND transporter periplasmic adaptor subunit [Acetatifactor sp.]|nr:efflux RND transporter periplasmic adaptor subunit [Acetatifactor sp.]